MNIAYVYEDNPLTEGKIENAALSLKPACKKILQRISKNNASIIADYIISMQTETNPSDHYKKDTIKLLCKFSQRNNNKPFEQITRQEVIVFLDQLRKPEIADPLHKWIGTYNLYRIYFLRFFKWLYYPDVESKGRKKPPVVDNIPQLKRREQSIYKPSDLWSQEDDFLFLKYCPSKRMKCYHSMSRDTGCRPHELLKLRIKDIVFKNSGDKQYAEVLLTGKTGSRHIPLIDSLPYIKDYLDYEHPQPTNFNAPLFAGAKKSLGRQISVTHLHAIYDGYKKVLFPKMLQNANGVPSEDKERIRDLLRKPWNPYIRRHSALTEKSVFLKEHVLRQHAGWSPRSQMHLKYLHYFGNESSDSILEAYGIITKDKVQSDTLRSKQCPNCNEPNKPDSKFCAKCRMVLTFDAYGEALESEKQKQDRLTLVEEKLSSTQHMIQHLIDGLGKITDQQQLNILAQLLFSSGILKEITPEDKKNINGPY
jgi:integrase